MFDFPKYLLNTAQVAIDKLNQAESGKLAVPVSLDSARRALLDPSTTATGVFLAAQQVLGSRQFVAWEPESVWVELHRAHQLDLPATNRDKLLAVCTCEQQPFWVWDANFLENMVMAFNDIPIAPQAIQAATPAQLAWGLFEAHVLMAQKHHDVGVDIDYEPTKYVAASLHYNGFVVAPDTLEFAQYELDKFNSKDAVTIKLKAEVTDKWNKLDKLELNQQEFDETPVGVQLARLSAVTLYVLSKCHQLNGDLLLI